MAKRSTIWITDTRTYVSHGFAQPGAAASDSFETIDLLAPRHPEKDPLSVFGLELAEQIMRRCPEMDGTRCVIPATWCFLREIKLAGEQRGEQAVRFALEEYLPLELERLTCASVECGQHVAIAAAVETAPFAAFLSSCETGGLTIEAIIPDAALFAETGERTILLRDQSRFAMVHRRGTSIALRAGLLPETEPDEVLIHHLATVSSGQEEDDLCVQTVFLPGHPAASDAAWDGETQAPVACAFDDAEWSIGRLLLQAAEARRFLDLRVGALASAKRWAPLVVRGRRCAFALALLLVALAVGGRLRTWDCERSAAQLRPQRDQIYATVYPGSTAPPGAALRLQSERIKLTALTQQDGPASNVQRNGLAALEVLHAVSANVPEQMKLFVNEIVLQPDDVRLSGLTTSHEAAGEFVQALNRLAELEVDPPRTKLRPDKTVDFQLSARRKGASND